MLLFSNGDHKKTFLISSLEHSDPLTTKCAVNIVETHCLRGDIEHAKSILKESRNGFWFRAFKCGRSILKEYVYWLLA
jgi:hypothetical protein